MDTNRRLAIASAYALEDELSCNLRTITFNLLSDLAEAIAGNQEKEDIIGGNTEAFKPLLTETVYLSIIEVGTSSKEFEAIATNRRALVDITTDSDSLKRALKQLKSIMNIGDVEDNYTLESLVAAFKTYSTDNKEVAGYDPETMEATKNVIKEQIIDCWKGIYQPFIDGLETMDGLVIPSGVLKDSKGRESQGMISTTSNEPSYKVLPYANAIYEEFICACKDVGIPMIEKCATDVNDSTPYRYNPKLQWRIATGYYNKSAYRKGWSNYKSAVLDQVVDKIAERIAVIKDRTGLDDDIYKAQSAYCTSLAIINYKNGLGFQIRACCGVNTKGEEFAKRFIQRIETRERGNRSLNFGKATIGEYSLTPGGGCVFSLYLNREAYYRVPDFMGEHLIKQDNFMPSMSSMIIGRKLDNSIMTLDMESGDTGWCVPIIAGSRSGKGVLTLNILLNVFACGIPLFYLDGKPDMSSLFSMLAKEAGVREPMIVDAIKYAGITPIDHKPFKFGYSNNLEAWIKSPNRNSLIAKHITVMTYIKMLVVIRLAVEYNNNVAHGPNLFVVADEVYAFSQKVNDLYKDLKLEISKNTGKENKDKKTQMQSIVNWLDSIFSDYVSAGIGVFGNGIKVLALSQYDAVGSYCSDDSSKSFENFASTIGLKGGGKCRIYGKKQEASSKGTYTWDGKSLSKSDKDLITLYRHFALTRGDVTIQHNDIFKPMLVLNECDAVEYQNSLGNNISEDGPFVENVVSGIPKDNKESFRKKYFCDSRMAASIGFEGALEELARCSGKDAKKMIFDSFESASKLATDALKYYGVIGNNGLETVYDYITSTSLDHLWTIGEIMDAFNSGRKLGPAGQDPVESAEIEPEQRNDSMFSSFEVVEDEQDEQFNGESSSLFGAGLAGAGLAGAGLAAEKNVESAAKELGLDEEILSSLGIDSSSIDKDAINDELRKERELFEAAKQQREQSKEDSLLGEYSEEDFEEDYLEEDFEDPEYTESTDNNLDDYLEDDLIDVSELAPFKKELTPEEKLALYDSYNPEAWKDVSDEEIERVVTNIMDATPDNTDNLAVMSSLIGDDVDNGDLDPIVAEAIARKYNLADLGYTSGYNYGLRDVEVIPLDNSNINYGPYIDNPNEINSAIKKEGKKQKSIRIDADRTKVTSMLNDTNSIDCRRAGVGRMNALSRMMLRTPAGAQRYIDKLWDSILETAIDQGYKPAVITRASLYDDNMTLNGKILILDGIIGGRDDIRLVDIVNFRILFRRFPLLRVLRIDTGFLQSAITEFGDDVVGTLFKIGKKLDVVEIITNGEVLKCTRQKYLNDKRLQLETERARLSNEINLQCKSKNPSSWGENTASDNIWGMKLARRSASKAADLFNNKSKPSFVKNIAYGGLGIVGGILGGTIWLTGKAFRGITGIRKGFLG